MKMMKNSQCGRPMMFMFIPVPLLVLTTIILLIVGAAMGNENVKLAGQVMFSSLVLIILLIISGRMMIANRMKMMSAMMDHMGKGKFHQQDMED